MAAENREEANKAFMEWAGFNEAAAHGRGKPRLAPGAVSVARQASMRPRRMAAENAGGFGVGHVVQVASMRPRRMAAENKGAHREDQGPDLASMRPRRMAAENDVRSPGRRRGATRFNEAAAHGRGKPQASAAGPPLRPPALQ